MAVKTVVSAGGNWNVAGTWTPSGVPAVADQVIFTTQSGPLTISATATIEQISFRNYKNVIRFNSPLILTGNMDLGTPSNYTMSGTYGIQITDISSITSSGVTFTQPLSLRGTSDTITFNDPFILNNDLEFLPTTQLTLNGSTLSLYHDLIHGNNAIITGTTNIHIRGNGEWRHLSNGEIRNNVILEPSTGTFSLRGEIYYGQRTLSYRGGTVSVVEGSTYSTINIQRNTSLDTSTLRLYNMHLSSIHTLDLVSNMHITGTLSVVNTVLISGTGSMMFTDNSNEVVGSLSIYPTSAVSTFTFSKSATVSNALIGGDFNLTVNQNTLFVKKSLFFLQNENAYDPIYFNFLERTISGTTVYEMCGTGDLGMERSFWSMPFFRGSVNINTTGTVSLAPYRDFSVWIPKGQINDYRSRSNYFDWYKMDIGSTLRYISGNFRPIGDLVLQEGTSVVTGFGSVTFSRISFSRYDSNNIVRSLSSNLICTTFSTVTGGDSANDNGRTITINSNTFSVFARNFELAGTVSGTAPIRVYGSGKVDVAAYKSELPKSSNWWERPISNPFFIDNGFLQLAKSNGIMFRNNTVTINSGGFTWSNSPSNSDIYPDVVWFSGTTTYSNIAGSSHKIGLFSRTNTPTSLRLTNTMSVADYLTFLLDDRSLLSFNNATFSIIGTRFLDLSNSSVHLYNGHINLDHGITASSFIIGPTGYSLQQPNYTNPHSQRVFSSGEIRLNNLINYQQDSDDHPMTYFNSTIKLIGNGSLRGFNTSGNLPGYIYANIDIETSGTLRYDNFRWGSTFSDFDRFRYISGTFASLNPTSSLIFGGYGGYINLGNITYSRLQFGELEQRIPKDFNSFTRRISSRSFIIESNINTSDRLIFAGTNSWTMSSFRFNNGGDFETIGPGEINLLGGMNCRDYIVDDDTYTNAVTKLYNGSITASRNLTVTSSSTHILSGTSSIVLSGTGSWQHRVADSEIELNLTINTPGTITILGNVYFEGATLSYISGTVSHNSTSNLVVNYPATFNTFGMTWAAITLTGTGSNAFITTNSSLEASGTMSISQATDYTIAGTGGFRVNRFYVHPTSVSTTRLQPSLTATYSVFGNIDFNDNATSTNRHLITSVQGSYGPTWTTGNSIFVLELGATQDCAYVNATNLRSTGGQTIYTYKGTLTNTTGWAQLPTQLRTISSSSAT